MTECTHAFINACREPQRSSHGPLMGLGGGGAGPIPGHAAFRGAVLASASCVARQIPTAVRTVACAWVDRLQDRVDLARDIGLKQFLDDHAGEITWLLAPSASDGAQTPILGVIQIDDDRGFRHGVESSPAACRCRSNTTPARESRDHKRRESPEKEIESAEQ